MLMHFSISRRGTLLDKFTGKRPKHVTTPQAIFGQTLQQVVGQAFTAAGYELQDFPMHQMRGLFRYQKRLENEGSSYVEFQLLYYAGGVSRFRVNLLRNSGDDARAQAADKIETTLARLLWDEFGVEQLSGPDHWWLFNNPTELGYTLLEAGRLTFGFGIPWLEGTLEPDSE
jgi:hypothetical protein